MKFIENALKGLMMAAGVVITCIIIGIGFYAARISGDTAAASAEQLIEFRNELEEGDLMKYDGLSVTGTDVVNITRKLLNGYGAGENAPTHAAIYKNGKIRRYKNSEYLNELRNYESLHYISPTRNFAVRLIRDENDVITEIRFDAE